MSVSAKQITVLKKILAGLFFIGLMASPAILKPDKIGYSAGGEFGFELKEVSKEVGINFVHQSPTLDEKISHILPQIASVGASVSVCDFNKDGWNDLYFTNSQINTSNAFYINNGDGTFTDLADSLEVGGINKEETGSGVSWL